MNESMVELTIDGKAWKATVIGGSVRIDCNGIWAGSGSWTGTRIVDCPADLPEGVYEALERAIVEGDVDAQSEEPETAHLASGGRIETEEHRRQYAAERLSEVREDWSELERPEQRDAIDEWLAAHPGVRVGQIATA